MLVGDFLFSARPILILVLTGGVSFITLFVAYQLRNKRDVKFFVGFACVIMITGIGGALWSASSEAADQRGGVQAMHDLKLEGFAVQDLDFWHKQVTIRFGQRACSLTLDLADAYGHDPDGYKQRWRPTLTPSLDDGLVGLGAQDLKSLGFACTP